MRFGDPTEFAIEVHHEPSGPEWAGFGRMCIDTQNTRLGDISENHCSLFHAVDRFRELESTIDALWEESFDGLSDAEIFAFLDEALYLGEVSGWERFGRFDFLTNTGEQFDGFKTFIVCSPDRHVHILYRLPDGLVDAGICSAVSFHAVAESFVLWFDEQVRTVRPPYFPVEPLINP
jgi:hypothetical protein